MDDEFFMREAVKEAELALEKGDFPIGCVIVIEDKIIARAHTTSRFEKDKLCHAEINALKKAKEKLQDCTSGATLYTTYEPCPMCFGACVLSNVKRVVYGINVDESGATHLKDYLPLRFKNSKYEVEFVGGVLENECLEVFMKGKPTQNMIKEKRLKQKKTNQNLFK